MRSLWKQYSLGIIFLVQWVAFTILYGAFLLLHRQQPDSFWYEFLAGIFENLQSEAFQFGVAVALASVYHFRGSQQSKEGQERIEAILTVLLPMAAKGAGVTEVEAEARVQDELKRRALPYELWGRYEP